MQISVRSSTNHTVGSSIPGYFKWLKVPLGKTLSPMLLQVCLCVFHMQLLNLLNCLNDTVKSKDKKIQYRQQKDS